MESQDRQERSQGKSRLRDLSSLFSAGLLKIAVGTITGALAFRALGPQNMGGVATALSVAGLFSLVAEFGLRDAAVREIVGRTTREESGVAEVAGAFFWARTVLGALAALLLWAAAGTINDFFYPHLQLAPLLRTGALMLFTTGLLAYSQAVLEARQQFGRLSLLNSAQTLLRAALLLLLLLIGLTALRLILLDAFVPLIVFLISLLFVPRGFLARPARLIEHWRRLFRFSRWIALAAAAGLIVSRLDVLFLSFYADVTVVGLYAAALALIAALNLVKTPILTTAFPEANKQSSLAQLRRYLKGSLRLTLIVSLLLLPLFAIGPWLITLLYGTDYLTASPAFYLLLAAFILGLNSEPAAYIFYPLNRPQWFAVGDIILLIATISIGPFLIQAHGMMGAAGLVLLRQTIGTVYTGLLIAYALYFSYDSAKMDRRFR